MEECGRHNALQAAYKKADLQFRINDQRLKIDETLLNERDTVSDILVVDHPREVLLLHSL